MSAGVLARGAGGVGGRSTKDTYDEHMGWETPDQKAARIASDVDYAAQNRFRSNAANNVNYSMSYTDPKSGMQMRYDPSSAASAKASTAATQTRPDERVSLATLTADYDRMAGPTPPRITGTTRADRTAANEAAYGRAKSKVGLQNRASMNSLRNMMSERGIEGSGMEAAAGANIIGQGQGQLADVVMAQTGADVAREQQVEDRDYAGGINQRGQDMQQQQAKRAAIEALFSMRTGGGANARLY